MITKTAEKTCLARGIISRFQKFNDEMNAEPQSFLITDAKKQLLVVCTASLAGFMAVLNSSIVNISLPTIAHDLNVAVNIVSRVVIVYYLMLTSTLLLFGKLEDLVGVKKVFLAGYLVFTLGSLLCGLSGNLFMLVISRCVQGLGGAILGATMVGVISRYLPTSRKGWGFGLVTTASALGITLGAPLGGFITAYADWHWIFLINLPFGAIAMLLVHFSFPEDTVRIERGSILRKLDVPGIMLSFISLSTLLSALNLGKDCGWASPLIVGLFITFVISLIIFVFRERATSDPLLDPAIFRNRDFVLVNLSSLFAYMFLSGTNFLMPFFLSAVKGMRVDAIGLMLLFVSISMSIMSPIAGKMSDRIHSRILTSSGMVLLFGSGLIFLLSIKGSGYLAVVLYLIFQGISYGLFLSPNNSQATKLAPSGKEGIVSGVIRLNCNLGQSLGVTVMGTVFSLSIPHGYQGCPCQAHAHVPLNDLYGGFQHGYGVGVLLIAVSLICALFSGEQSRRTIEDKEKEVSTQAVTASASGHFPFGDH